MWNIFGISIAWVWCYIRVLILGVHCSFKKKFNKSSKENVLPQSVPKPGSGDW